MFPLIFLVCLAAAIYAISRGVPVEIINDWIVFEALPPLVSIVVVFAVTIGTWAVFQVGLAIWQRRRAKQNR